MVSTNITMVSTNITMSIMSTMSTIIRNPVFGVIFDQDLQRKTWFKQSFSDVFFAWKEHLEEAIVLTAPKKIQKS